MARYTGPKCKLCRREGTKLFLKGARCFSEKCAVVRNPQTPGVHGTSRKRPSDYAVRLREKQKVKRIYGVLERQFRKYFKESVRHTGQVGETLLQILESRLDSLVYVLGMGFSRSHARQMIRQGAISVDGAVVTTPSYRIKEGQVVGFAKKSATRLRSADVPAWISWNDKKKEGKIKELPKRDQLSQDINEQLIIEHYSR